MRRYQFFAILSLAFATVAAQLTMREDHTAGSPEAIKVWTPPSLLPGAKIAVLEGDPSKEGAVRDAGQDARRLQDHAAHAPRRTSA